MDNRNKEELEKTLNWQQIGYNIDICLCIDKTGSMSSVIDMIKNNVLNLSSDIIDQFEARNGHVKQLRIRLILFGDYLADKYPMLVSDFFRMPEDNVSFSECVQSIAADGGGDDPEDGLEALAYAIRSDWWKSGNNKRHVIALFTDAPAHELGYGSKSSKYPQKNMPKSFEELALMWGDKDYPGEMDFRTKRLLLFAPERYDGKDTVWKRIVTDWENVLMCGVMNFGIDKIAEFLSSWEDL